MKRMNKLFACLAAGLLFAACQSVEMDINLPQEEITQAATTLSNKVIITASLTGDITETRTSRGTDLKIYWSPKDELKVFSAGQSSKFTAINEEPSTIAQFEGTVLSIIGTGEDGSVSHIWGLYPYREDATYEDGGNSLNASITTTLPGIQASKEGTFADNMAIAIGRSITTNISFKNAYSGFRVNFSRDDIMSVTLKGGSGEPVAGRVTLGLDSEGVPIVKSIVEPETSITMFAENGAFEPNTDYYIITLPDVELPQGYVLTVRTKDGSEGVYTAPAPNMLSRNVFKNLTSNPLDLRIADENWHSASTQGVNEIWYTTTDNSAVSYVVPSYIDTRNEVDADNCVAPADNGGVGIIRFKGPLTKIDDEVFYNPRGAKLRSVSFPDCVETIGSSAFDSCENLSEVHFGAGLKEIGEWAFSYTNLSEIDLPDGLELIGNSAFNHTNLTSVHIPESVVHLAKMSYYGFDSIGGNPFWECFDLQRFTGKFSTDDGRALIQTTPDGKRVLVSFATAGMDNETYTVPAVDRIGLWAFYGSTLGQVIFPAGLQIISDAAFSNCNNLTSLDFPGSVNEICGNAFYGCSNLEFIKLNSTAIPSMVTSAPFRYYTGRAFDGSNCKIYVPVARLKYYKTAEYWDVYEDRIEGYVNFTDPAFEAFMIDSNNDFDIDGNGIISTDETENIEEIKYNASNYGSLSSTSGIQYLPNLKKFSLDNGGADCQLISLAYENAAGLKSLVLENCGAFSIATVLSRLTELTNLEITACTGFTSLDLWHNKKLVFLRVNGMPALTYLRLADYSESMLQLLCYNNSVESINVSGFPNLKQLTCFNNSITELDVSSNANLEKLYCDPNDALQTIYVSSMEQVKTDWKKPSTATYVVR